MHAQYRKHSVRDQYRLDLLGLLEAGDGDPRVIPHPHVFEGPAVIPVGEVQPRGLFDLV